MVNSSYGCTDEVGGSGLASCVGDVANGTAIDTSSLGGNTFTVTGTDNAGNSTVVIHSYTVVDVTPPVSGFTSAPPDPDNDPTPTFAFTGTDDNSPPGALTFECNLDAGGYLPCTSPKTLDPLAEGSHTLLVRATDEAGNIESTASHTWFVDLTEPVSTIDVAPADPDNNAAPTFEFSGTDNHSAPGALTFECDLDGAGFSPCTSPHALAGLTEGSHTFSVRATDEAGNTESTAIYTWFVDLTEPVSSLDVTPPDPDNNAAPTFEFSGTDNHSAPAALTFECDLDGAGFSSCTSPHTLVAVPEGSHTFSVRGHRRGG